MKIPIKTFRLDQIVEAYVAMHENTAGAKIVVLDDAKIKMKIKAAVQWKRRDARLACDENSKTATAQVNGYIYGKRLTFIS